MHWSKEIVVEKLETYEFSKTKLVKDSTNMASEEPLHMLDQTRRVKPLVPASVLIPLINHLDGITVLLTRRTDNLKHHAGQISFPGGRKESSDNTSQETALRETKEEIGLPNKEIDVVGQLDDYEVGTGFLITPFIGFVDPPIDLRLQRNEVAETFEAPLSFLTNPNNIRMESSKINGKNRDYFTIKWKKQLIWGATAGIIKNLAQRLWYHDLTNH